MKHNIDVDAILTPILGKNPTGESLRYTSAYDDIKEARRADDMLDMGEWQHEVKRSDWDRVVELAIDALTNRTKDLQIAAWLVEALAATDGFEGVGKGLHVMRGFLSEFWDHVYPEIEDDDLDFRAGPLEFLNDKVWLCLKEIPLTDPATTPGYSWMKWQESRRVGYEKDTLNQYGDVDDEKLKLRQELIAEGKITAEEFDGAVTKSSLSFYEKLMGDITACMDEFSALDQVVDEKFGRDAPRLSEFRSAIEDCHRLVSKILDDKRPPESDSDMEEQEAPLADLQEQVTDMEEAGEQTVQSASVVPQEAVSVGTYRVNRLLGAVGIEEAVWKDAVQKLQSQGIKPALEQLLGAACSAQSVRERSNYRLLMAKLCLKAERPDLARPIAEELNTLIEELQLSRWESPIWIAEALDTLYQCLTAEGASDDDLYRARELLTKLCTLDVTKALNYQF